MAMRIPAGWLIRCREFSEVGDAVALAVINDPDHTLFVWEDDEPPAESPALEPAP